MPKLCEDIRNNFKLFPTQTLTAPAFKSKAKMKINLIKPYHLYKKILFRQDAEKVHERFTKLGEKLGKKPTTKNIISCFFKYENLALKQKILGIGFENPIGLAAGFDYEAKLTQILPSIGFGFNSIGSITYGEYPGNAPPRLGRLPKSKSLLVNKGLKSTGAKKVINSIKKLKFNIPLGISIAKTNCKQTADDKSGIEDYVKNLKLWEKSKIGDFYELNISCPNAFGGEPFTTPKKLDNLLKETDKLKIKKPIFLKMPNDFSTKKTDGLCRIAAKHNISGLIFGNLTKNRNNPVFNKEEIKNATKGNFSGLPTKKLSNGLIKFTYKKYKDRFVIVGCGGVFSAKDAYKKIKLGASLVQLITGMVYEGPQLISKINKDLIHLMKKDKISNISQAVGIENT